MNFKEAYTQEMEERTPSDTSVDALRHAAAEPVKPQRSWGVKLGYTAAALSMILVGAVVVISTVDNAHKLPIPTDTNPVLQVADANYTNVYQAFQDIRERAAYENRETFVEYASDVIADIGSGWSMGTKAAPTPNRAAGDAALPETSQESAVTATGAAPDFSNTNIQIEGVQEGDIVKTDGRYIYALNSKTLTVIAANNGHPQVVAVVEAPAFEQDEIDAAQSTVAPMPVTAQQNPYSELYLTDNRLVAVRGHNSGTSVYYEDGEPYILEGDIATRMPDTAAAFPTVLTSADIFDISDPTTPTLITSYSVSGGLISSRMIDNILYLATEYGVHDYDKVKSDKPETFVPFTLEGETQCLVPPEDVKIYPNADSTSYTVVAGIDTAGKGKLVSQTSVLGAGSDLYANTDNLYILSYGELETDDIVTDATTITKVTLDHGWVTVENSKRLPGRVNNQFSLDEKDGILRAITTTHEDWEPVATTVYTLDSNLKVLGKVGKIAPDEELHSARYLGDYVYFVTFIQTDPLFTVDLSDPKNPKVVGELKIPGFSEYLHPYAPNLLFGLGSDADEDTGEVGALKISMFDTSDPTDIRELDKLVIKGEYYSEALENHHAILVNAEKNLIAFPTEGRYLVYSYSKAGGFKQVANIKANVEGPLRGLFIDQVFYVVAPEAIGTYRLPRFEQIDTLSFNL